MKTVPSKFSLLSEIVYTANFLFIATLPSISSVRNRALKIMRWQQRCATLMNGQGVTDSCFSIRVILPDGNPSLTFLRERYFSAPYLRQGRPYVIAPRDLHCWIPAWGWGIPKHSWSLTSQNFHSGRKNRQQSITLDNVIYRLELSNCKISHVFAIHAILFWISLTHLDVEK